MELKLDHDYHVVEIASLIPVHVIDWLNENFPDRWFYKSGSLYFESAGDHMMFLLRWGQ